MTDKLPIKKYSTIRVKKDFYDEIMSECERQDRTVAWMIKKSWQIAKETIKNLPAETTND